MNTVATAEGVTSFNVHFELTRAQKINTFLHHAHRLGDQFRVEDCNLRNVNICIRTELMHFGLSSAYTDPPDAILAKKPEIMSSLRGIL